MRKKWLPVSAAALLLSSGIAVADTEGFKDVSPAYWASSVINSLKDAHIIQGYADNTFKPDAYITRAEVAQMIYNEHQSMEHELSSKVTEDNVVATAVANTLPSVVVIHADNKLGAGVFIDQNHILTAEHVIDAVNSVTVTTLAGNTYAANVVAVDKDKDLALLGVKANGEKIRPIPFAAAYTIGQTAIAIGHPDGLNYSVSKGIISNADRKLDSSGAKLIQIDTAISPGNSGGPLVDAAGNLIGIVDAKINAKASEGLGFAISLDDIKPFVNENR
jgi:S1-C subfamily serine protease